MSENGNEQYIQKLEKEIADLKRELEGRQFYSEYNFHQQIGNYMVHTDISVCEIPAHSKKSQYDDKEKMFQGFTDYFEETGTLIAVLLQEKNATHPTHRH